MNHGPFYRSAELLAGVQRDEGLFAGFRAAHAYGRIYAGTFSATPVAKTLSRAAHFQGTPVPVTARFSGSSGDPKKNPSIIVAMATKFYLPDGTVTDLIAITLPVFFVRTPEEFLGFTEARAPDPATGQADLAKLGAFLARHPNAAKVVRLLQGQPAPVSFAQVSYRPLHAYYFVNAAGTGRWARYHWEPEAGVAGQPPEELAKQPHDYLYEELEGRLRAGPVAFRLELQLAGDGDPVDDSSAMWPDDREGVVVGRLELFRGGNSTTRRSNAVRRRSKIRITSRSLSTIIAGGSDSLRASQNMTIWKSGLPKVQLSACPPLLLKGTPMARRIRMPVPMPRNSRANIHTASSPAVSGTTCLRKLRRLSPKLSSTLVVIDPHHLSHPNEVARANEEASRATQEDANYADHRLLLRFGVASLPLGTPDELEIIYELAG
jgi:catalase